MPPSSLIVCLLIPRGFLRVLVPVWERRSICSTGLVTTRTKRFQVPDDGWWVHIKYYLLAGTLVAAVCGVLVSGFVSAIPVITRGLLFVVDPLQSGLSRGWHLVPGMNAWPRRFDRTFLGCAGAWVLATKVLVQVRLSQRRCLFSRQLVSSHRAQSRILLHPLQQVRRDLSLSTRSSLISPRGPRIARCASRAVASVPRTRSSSWNVGTSFS